jgi:diadenosine tetraphosphatase ApaH/serine/threonine PP2A family protein phosphatase
MRIALISDIHANREALTAVLAHARLAGFDRIGVLGDLVGYGADPEFAVETVEALVAEGAFALLGNHDEAVSRPSRDMNPTAEAALEWTRGLMKPSHRAFLERLSLTHAEGGVQFVHASAEDPARWIYVLEPRDAERCLAATNARVVIVGHTHAPALFHMGPTGRAERFRPVVGTPVPLLKQRRWVAVIGSVGQPRDGSAAAGYALLDTDKATLTWLKVPYDVQAAAAKVRAVGLPETLARRLMAGR